MSRSCSHESQNACPKSSRAGRCPSGDSPIASHSCGANVSTISTSDCVPASNWSSNSAFGTSRSVATCASVAVDGSKRSRNIVGARISARRAEREHPVLVDRDQVADDALHVPLGAARRRLPLRVRQRAGARRRNGAGARARGRVRQRRREPLRSQARSTGATDALTFDPRLDRSGGRRYSTGRGAYSIRLERPRQSASHVDTASYSGRSRCRAVGRAPMTGRRHPRPARWTDRCRRTRSPRRLPDRRHPRPCT